MNIWGGQAREHTRYAKLLGGSLLFERSRLPRDDSGEVFYGGLLLI